MVNYNKLKIHIVKSRVTIRNINIEVYLRANIINKME